MTYLQDDDAPPTIDLNPTLLLDKLDGWLDGFVSLLPNLVVAALLMGFFWLASKLVKRWVIAQFARHDRENLGQMLGGFARTSLLVLGALLGATIVAPSLQPGDLLAGLGVSSVAIGFAFKDILQNWLAGMLILIRQPFQVGDQIEIGDFTGTVEAIETRSTLIKTYDAQRAVVPNSEIYTNAVLVKTAYPKRRSEYDIGIGYGDDLREACQVILETIQGVDGVEQDPKPEALPWDLAASWVTIRARWWTDTAGTNLVAVRAEVLASVKLALDEAGIDMPFETVVELHHDQTEESDGDRSAQREGWPGARSGATTPRWKVQTASSA